jgi:elongation factor P
MQVPLKRGMLIRHQGHTYAVAEFQERRTGKQRATVHVLLRDTRDGHQVDRTLDQIEPIEEVPSSHHDLQYLYPAGETWVFMDTESFEQYELTESQLHGCQPFLKEGESYRSLFADQQPLTLEMADIIALQVTSTAPPTHSVGSQSSVMKEAMLENGLEVRVPLFIKAGDMIRVNRRDKAYAGKESR